MSNVVTIFKYVLALLLLSPTIILLWTVTTYLWTLPAVTQHQAEWNGVLRGRVVEMLLETLSYDYLTNNTYFMQRGRETLSGDAAVAEARLDDIDVKKSLMFRKLSIEKLPECYTNYQEFNHSVNYGGTAKDTCYQYYYFGNFFFKWCDALDDTRPLVKHMLSLTKDKSFNYRCVPPNCLKTDIPTVILIRHPFERFYTVYFHFLMDLKSDRHHELAMSMILDSRVDDRSKDLELIQETQKFFDSYNPLTRHFDMGLFDNTNKLMNPFGPTFEEYLKYLIKYPHNLKRLKIEPICKACSGGFHYTLNYYSIDSEMLLLPDANIAAYEDNRYINGLPKDIQKILFEVQDKFNGIQDTNLIMDLFHVYKTDFKILSILH